MVLWVTEIILKAALKYKDDLRILGILDKKVKQLVLKICIPLYEENFITLLKLYFHKDRGNTSNTKSR